PQRLEHSRLRQVRDDLTDDVAEGRGGLGKNRGSKFGQAFVVISLVNGLDEVFVLRTVEALDQRLQNLAVAAAVGEPERCGVAALASALPPAGRERTSRGERCAEPAAPRQGVRRDHKARPV